MLQCDENICPDKYSDIESIAIAVRITSSEGDVATAVDGLDVSVAICKYGRQIGVLQLEFLENGIYAAEIDTDVYSGSLDFTVLIRENGTVLATNDKYNVEILPVCQK